MASTMRALRLARGIQRQLPVRQIPAISQPSRSYAIEARPATDSKSPEQAEQASEDLVNLTGVEDPAMNGNYPDPSQTSALPIKRQFRDPHADWWDKQERRNYGEPVHEDNDILGIFSPEQYTWVTPGKGALQVLAFVAAFGSLVYGISFVYPDRPSAPRTFPGGLEAELGGPGAVRAHNEDEGDKVAAAIETAYILDLIILILCVVVLTLNLGKTQFKPV